jgi:RHS repeat-associated protein
VPFNQHAEQKQQADGTSRDTGSKESFQVSAPSISLLKGGGAIKGIGEKFAANPVTGTGSMTVPIATSPGRSGFGPQLSLSYDSGAGNGPFGFGWSLSLPSISRRTDKGLPRYWDADESDIFILSGAEDLVPVLVEKNGKLERQPFDSLATEPGYIVQRYRPRIEGLFARIERWTDKKTGISHWRSISKDNITTLYGKREDARIADPNDITRIFTWLICESYDDKGNAILYEYKSEDDKNIDRTALHERNRLRGEQFPQRYLKHIKYGNRTPRVGGEDLTARTDWLFEVVFDYGEHDPLAPTTSEVQLWPVRQDPFSLYRATFDVRTYRLCRRVLMFHHFPDDLESVHDYLVRSTDFDYVEGPVASFVASVTQSGYVRQPDGSYFKKSLPKLQFKYTEVQVDETVHEIDPDSIENLPYGADGSHYQWVDLDSEGLSGVLTEQATAWFYKRNLGNGTFGAIERIATRPAIAALSGGQQQLLDLAGEGQLELVQFDGPSAGFFERTPEGTWNDFKPFLTHPNISTKDPNLRFVDITGDGHADILISEDTVFTWYTSRAKDGFDPAERTPQSWDVEAGPKLIFADPTQSIFLSDMSGDGLTDLVRIRNGELCYWPNLGYGRFGAKVAMGNAPVFDYPDNFDPRRIHLADIAGSGNTDIIYLSGQSIDLYFNQSGNAWSPPQRLIHYPKVDNLKAVTALDLLGNGTACLVWSSPLTSDIRQPMRYIDLMGGQKPHLLVYTNNNMGAETEVQYAASTQFYLQDRLEGRPWVTKLPFPVHVIERVEHRDLVSNTKLVSTYRYRHGYFDGVEREFRGFANVEQRDAESVVGEFDLPPVVTKTWFHTGAYLEGDKLEAYFKAPENKEYFNGDDQSVFLPDTNLPLNLTATEMREACRALKGSILRQEIYSDDASAKAALPYSVSERSYRLTRLQPRGPNLHAIFFSHPSETIDYHYERNPADPRISHALTLEVDNYGNMLKSVAIGYARRAPEFDEQKPTLATLTENQYTHPILEDDNYRTPLPAEAKTYELTAPTLKGTGPLDLSTVQSIAAAAVEISYEDKPTSGQTQKRLIEQVRTLYRKNDLSGLLTLARLESMALPGESYKRALTPGLLDIFQSKLSRAELTTILSGIEGGYRDLDGNGSLWIPSGLIFFSPTAGDSVQQESAFARPHFFLPHRFRDPFGNSTVVGYEGKYTLLLVSTRDAVGNEVIADPDYRVLQPLRVTDPNGNRTEVRFDALGMVVGTAVMGKTGEKKGDSFATFTADLTQSDIQSYFDAANPRPLAITHLGTATTRIIYDLDRIPACAASIARETHVSDLQGKPTKVQLSFVYSDGFGREAQTKVQAEPGPLDPNDSSSAMLDPRWVGTGAKVYNNKGKPIRQYEPFFSPTHHFGIEKQGISSTLFYDPVERVVATLHPNNTYEKVVYDPWQQTTYDVNDTVTFDPKNDSDVEEFFSRLQDTEYLPTWYQDRINGGKGPDEKTAAEKATKHADTPTVAHFDTLGRTFATIADNGKDAGGSDQKYRTRIVLDIEGNQREVIDARNRIVMRYDYDMLGTPIHQASMEAGERWTLNDATGKPIHAWSSRKYAFRTEYDSLRRPLRSFVQGGDPSEPNAKVYVQEILVERTIYGESADTRLTESQQRQANLRGKVYQHFDSAGKVTTDLYDFKGSLLRSSRQFTSDYKDVPDWSQNPTLEAEIFASATTYDALNRPATLTTPDNSIYRPTFNEANLLDKVEVNLRGAATATPFVANIDYNAKSQRTRIDYGNGASTTYEYDPDIFRLIHLNTLCGGTAFQDLRYTYDPTGNITHIHDDAQQTIYFNGQVVEPHCDYVYDAIYRLIEAKGREHIGQLAPPETSWNDEFRVNLPHPQDGKAMRNYTEQYGYDAVGNFEQLMHQAANGGWTRKYAYNEASLIEPMKQSNRLSSTRDGQTPENYTHDAHGNMTQMTHLPSMLWDFKDQLRITARQAVNNGKLETTYYLYDASGQRVRKVTERQNRTRKDERIYLGGFEMYREYDGTGNAVTLERETLHVMDDKKRVALVETRTQGHDGSPARLIRYQFGNHLGSASLELDGQAQVISYEEYYPHGSTSYQAVTKAVNAVAKRYRYTGKERDEETGFTYHGARYYAPWLGRWTSSDSIGIADRPNLYVYVRNNPMKLSDDNGHWPKLIENLVNDPMGTAKRAAQAGAQIAIGYGEALANKVASFNPLSVTSPGAALVTDLVPAVVEKGKQEIKEVKEAYGRAGGGARGAVAASARAMAGPVLAHATDAMAKAAKSGSGPLGVIDAGLAKVADATNAANPLYHLGVAVVGAPVAAQSALGRGDYRGVGKQILEGQSSGLQAAEALVPVAGELGLLGEAATGLGAGTRAVSKSGALFSSSELAGVERATPELVEAVGKKRVISWATAGSDELKFLEMRNAEGASFGPEDIILRPNPSKAAVLEEFLHGTQQKLGIIERLGTTGLGSAETHVKDFMIRHSKMLGLGAEDVRRLQILRDKGL